jgi:hypothetical protein
MTRDEFAKLSSDFTHSAESGDRARFANHFTEDAKGSRAKTERDVNQQQLSNKTASTGRPR